MFRLLFLILILTCFNAEARRGGYVVGNGGDGFLLDDNETILLRDLVEMNISPSDIQIDPLFLRPKLVELLKTKFSAVSPVPVEELALHLSKIYNEDRRWTFILLRVIQAYNWVFVDQKLEPVPSGVTVQLPEERLVQIANRFLNTIKINRKAFLQMPKSHQAALILHEALYALVRPTCVTLNQCTQPPEVVRSVVGNIYLGILGRHSLREYFQLLVEEETLSVKGDLVSTFGEFYTYQTQPGSHQWGYRIWSLGSCIYTLDIYRHCF